MNVVIEVITILIVLSIIIACINERYIESKFYTELTITFLLIPSIIVDAFLASNGVEILILLLPIWIIHIELAIIYNFLYKICNNHKMSKLNKSKNEIKKLINNINSNLNSYGN